MDKLNALTVNPKEVMDKSAIKQLYEHEAERYLFKRPYMRSYVFQRITNLLSGFLKDNTTVLNIGCGPGYLEKNLLAGSENFYVALDISREMVKMTKYSVPQVEVIVADAEALPFRQSSFNLIICSRVIKFLNYPKLLCSLKDILKVKGLLAIIFDSGDSLWIRLLERFGKYVDHVGNRSSILRVRDLDHVLRKLSFETVTVNPITFLPLSIFNYIPPYLYKLLQFFDNPKKRGRITTIVYSSPLEVSGK